MHVYFIQSGPIVRRSPKPGAEPCAVCSVSLELKFQGPNMKRVRVLVVVSSNNIGSRLEKQNCSGFCFLPLFFWKKHKSLSLYLSGVFISTCFFIPKILVVLVYRSLLMTAVFSNFSHSDFDLVPSWRARAHTPIKIEGSKIGGVVSFKPVSTNELFFNSPAHASNG